jgi:DNA-binding response OmpR family regulator
VEDEERVRKLAVKILKSQGYLVLEASDGPSCLEELEGYDRPIDLLLTDVVMPGMNGRELFRELRAFFPDLAVLYMSGYTEDIITHRGVLDEGIPFIQKPFSVHSLTTRIRAALEEERD